jgi:excinuclease ABC subunit B
VHAAIETLKAAEGVAEFRIDTGDESEQRMPIEQQIEKLTAEMKAAAKELQFEKAAALRDQIAKLKKL